MLWPTPEPMQAFRRDPQVGQLVRPARPGAALLLGLIYLGVCEDNGGLWLRPSGASRELWRSRGWGSRAGAPLIKATRPQRVPGTCVQGSGWQGQAWGAWLG